MHVILAAEDSEAELLSELRQSFPGAAARWVQNGLIETGFSLIPGERLPYLAMVRQFLPDAKLVAADSVRAWAQAIFDEILAHLSEGQPWSLHVVPHYGSHATHRMGARAWHSLRLRGGESGRKFQTQNPDCKVQSLRFQVRNASVQHQGEQQFEASTVDARAGRHRCSLIKETTLQLLGQKRRQLLRLMRRNPAPFAAEESLVQALLTDPGRGFLSVAVAPRPFEQRHLISFFPKGDVPLATDKAAPSRAFAKLVEAELRLGCAIRAGERCVDLGAAPGSWTYVALGRQAQVIAVDRAPLREDLMNNPLVHSVRGDAFRFTPREPVDWLLCDLISPAERTSELLLKWLRNGWCRRFVVTLKLKDTFSRSSRKHSKSTTSEVPFFEILDRLKRELPHLSTELRLSRLSANKKEVCVFGVATVGSPRGLRNSRGFAIT